MNKNKKTAPIAVFDSGLGGMSVLRQLILLMPQENYIYFGDSAHAPYGTKTAEEVCALTSACIEVLLKKEAKAVVLACNTATSVTVNLLREKYPRLPVIGIEPAIKPAVEAHPGGRILVLATAMTLQEQKFALLLDRYKDAAEIISLPAPGIVEFVEQGVTAGPELDAYLQELLSPFRRQKPDGIVLGCTHFPFVTESILKAIGSGVDIFDGADGTARETQRQLVLHGLLNSDAAGRGDIEMINSNPHVDMAGLFRKLLQT